MIDCIERVRTRSTLLVIASTIFRFVVPCLSRWEVISDQLLQSCGYCKAQVCYCSIFVGAAAKRKRGAANAAAQEAQSSKLTSLSILKPTDEKELAIQIEKARSGSNEELNRRRTIIERDIDKRIASADRLRKLQIKNINDLYEYEVSALQAQREVRLKLLLWCSRYWYHICSINSVRCKKPKINMWRNFKLKSNITSSVSDKRKYL